MMERSGDIIWDVDWEWRGWELDANGDDDDARVSSRVESSRVKSSKMGFPQ